MSELILRLPAVMQRVGICRASIYEYIRAGEFPAQVKLGRRSVGWHSKQIDEWIATRSNGSTVQENPHV